VIAIQEEEQYVRLEQKRIEQMQEKRRSFWKQVRRWGSAVNSWFLAFWLLGGIYALGVHTGINLLPKGVVCQQRESLCYWLRFDRSKRTLH
jgi:hypothetical protein